jgi:hypothetical protein
MIILRSTRFIRLSEMIVERDREISGINTILNRSVKTGLLVGKHVGGGGRRVREV